MIERIYVSEATLQTIERYGQNNLTTVSGKPDEHLCVEFVRAAPSPTVAADAAEPTESAGEFAARHLAGMSWSNGSTAQPDERAAFEKDVRREGWNISRDVNGDYVHPGTQCIWEGWQARAVSQGNNAS